MKTNDELKKEIKKELDKWEATEEYPDYHSISEKAINLTIQKTKDDMIKEIEKYKLNIDIPCQLYESKRKKVDSILKKGTYIIPEEDWQKIKENQKNENL